MTFRGKVICTLSIRKMRNSFFFVQYCGKCTEENDHFMGNNISNAKGGQDTFGLCTSEKLVILKNKVNLRNISHMSDLGGWCVNRNKQMLSGVT